MFFPNSAEDLRDLLAASAAHRTPLSLEGRGSKQGLGRTVVAPKTVSLRHLAGIGVYEPEELVLSAGPGTPLVEVIDLLAKAGQMLAFEPPNLSHLWGGDDPGTLGGVIACNLSGSRRIAAGAARDHLLGFSAVSGRGELFKSGSRMVKNVTGYDLAKLLAGSFGTLAVMTDVTVKTLPRPEKTRTVLVYGLDDGQAGAAMQAALGSAHELSGAAHLPAPAAALSSVDLVSTSGKAVTALRVEGVGPSVAARCTALRDLLAPFGPVEELHSSRSLTLWREISEARLLGAVGEGAVWKLSVPPAAGPGVLAACAPFEGAFYDWGGGLIWLRVSAARPDAGAEAMAEGIRAAVAGCGGQATLMVGSAPLKAAISPFHPLPPAVLALNQAIKRQFDPLGLLNPGRLYAGF